MTNKNKIPGVKDRMIGNDAQQQTQQQTQAPGLVKVRALVHMHEQEHHEPGETFETTPERAAALGSLIEIIEPAAEEQPAE